MATFTSVYHSGVREDQYLGTWKIVECVSLAGTVDTTGIEGSEFHLDDSGDVSWKVADDVDAMPFFNSDTYEILFPPGKMNSVQLKFFGTLAEHVIEFNVEISDELMLLTCDRCCMLQCQKVSTDDTKGDCHYTFGRALEEGYFSDLVITAESGHQFQVHSLILGLSCPEMDWWHTPPPLTGLREDVLGTVLHYLYTECLPKGLSEETVKVCIKTVSRLQGMDNFVKLCNTFLKNTALRQQIVNLIGDMHTSADRIIEMFKCKKNPITPGTIPEDALAANPPRLCYVMKQAAREAAIASSKFVLLCDLFARRSGELPQEERHEIIRYARSRLPIFVKQLKEFFESFKYQMSFVGPNEKQEISTYILPEVETLCTMLTKFTEEFKAALDKAITKNISEKEKGEEKGEKHKHVKDVLGKTLRHVLHVRELKKLKHMHDTASKKFETAFEKLGRFNRKPNAEKIIRVSLIIDELKDREAPMLVGRVEQLALVLEEKFKWRQWKYLFKLGSSKVAWAVNKLCCYKATLASSIQQMVEMVHKDEFTASLTALSLYTADKSQDGETPSQQDRTNATYAHLSSVESLCVPPLARNSKLAKHSIDLLKKGQKTDMMFEIIIVHDVGDTVIDHTHGEPIARAESDRDVDIYEIPAHRVILASRCNWFCRALLSGMRESIDKKITVHDTNPEVFNLFLEYLYSGQVGVHGHTTEQLSDLLTLADRYEVDSLKLFCEHALQRHIDNDTAVYLFSLADQLQTKSLKERALSYMVDNPTLAEGEVYLELPQHLKDEVHSAILSGSSSKTRLPRIQHSDQAVVEMINEIDLNSGDDTSSSSSGDFQYEELDQDPGRMDRFVAELREVVGDEPSDEDLASLLLSADFDLNRAINFFYTS
ncbi:uncharacterized protein LOC117328099 [Pecten maximus]|uniref:uncharacterized protein LOC117328099 n=1 Tax=Pecten maximus TaxID=6579 RepID=UPI001458C11C|nr:uncharacterized protein LOC117328099 [Pecten maximus]